MKFFFFTCLLFFAFWTLVSAPLENGNLASASREEKELAFVFARNRLINAAIKYENTPYKYGGVSSDGLDCSGLIFLSFREALGVSVPRSAARIYSWTEKISLEEVQSGDLLFFKTTGTDEITHVALYLGNRQIIHSASSGPETGVIYSSIDEQYWARTYAGAGRAFPKVSSEYLPFLTSRCLSD